MGKRKLSENDLPFFHGSENKSGKEGGEIEMRLPASMNGVPEKLQEKGWPAEKICEAMSTLSFFTSMEATGQIGNLQHLAFDHKSLAAAHLLTATLEASKRMLPLLKEVEVASGVPFLTHSGSVTELDDALKATQRLIEELDKVAKGDTLH